MTSNHLDINAVLSEEIDATQGSTLGVAWVSLRSALELRLTGNLAFDSGRGDMSHARALYLDAEAAIAKAERLMQLENLKTNDPCSNDRFMRIVPALRGPLHSNLSLICLRLGDAQGARRHANISLAADPPCIKARYRRAMASLALCDYCDAEADLRIVLEAQPANSEARAAFKQCRQASLNQSGRRKHQQEGVEPASATPAQDSKLELQVETTLESVSPSEPMIAQTSTPPPFSALDKIQDATLGLQTQAEIETWVRRNGVSALLSLRTTLPAVHVRGHDKELDPPQTILGALCGKAFEGRVQDEIVRLMQSLSVDESRNLLSQKGSDLHSPIHIAAACGNMPVLEALLDARGDVDVIDGCERTPMHFAAMQGHMQIASLLLDMGCEADSHDASGRSPLYYAGVLDNREVAALLVKRGRADQSILLHALKEKFGTHNFRLHDWPEYNGRWMTSKEGLDTSVPLRQPKLLPHSPRQVQMVK